MSKFGNWFWQKIINNDFFSGLWLTNILYLSFNPIYCDVCKKRIWGKLYPNDNNNEQIACSWECWFEFEEEMMETEK